MRIKLDENLPAESADDLRAAGHDVETVFTEGLAGRADMAVARAAQKEDRVLFTLDKGLGDVRRFPPSRFGGIVVFRFRSRGRIAVRHGVKASIARLPDANRISGRLTIVSETSVRSRR